MKRVLRTGSDQVTVGKSLPWKSILVLVVLVTVGMVSSAISQDADATEAEVVEAVATEAPSTEAVSSPVIEAVFGPDLDRENRALTGQADEFWADVEQIYCLTRIQGLEAPTTITHAWYHEGQSKARVELNVGSPDWRTWSSKKILPGWTGKWEVKVLDATGKVLGTFGFTVN
ncbi:MAG: DUF2914 domain-containing protein [Gemmatimonadales bacterium]|nr:DUF2914 domain-containing protein [Gemmatimonadales bacterium]